MQRATLEGLLEDCRQVKEDLLASGVRMSMRQNGMTSKVLKTDTKSWQNTKGERITKNP
jgi:hypothetical protein